MGRPEGYPTAIPTIPAIPPPLGLPTGSIRAVLALIMCGSIWYLALNGLAIPDILVESVLLVIGFYFGVRQGTAPAMQAAAAAALPPGTTVVAPGKGKQPPP